MEGEVEEEVGEKEEEEEVEGEAPTRAPSGWWTRWSGGTSPRGTAGNSAPW